MIRQAVTRCIFQRRPSSMGVNCVWFVLLIASLTPKLSAKLILKLAIRSMSKAGPHPVFLPAHVDALNKLSKRSGNHLGPQASTRLKVLLDLAAGKSYAKIKRDAKFSDPGLKAIRVRVENGGLPEMIREFELMEARLIERAQAPRGKRRGRPSTPSLQSLSLEEHAADDVVIELIYLQVASEMSVAVFGVRLPPSDPAAKAIATPLWIRLRKKLSAAIAAASKPPQWTEFPFDQWLRSAFEKLRAVHKWLAEPRINLSVVTPEPLSAEEQSERWRFYSFVAGDTTAAENCLARLLNQRTTTPVQWPVDRFIPLMEGFAYQLRITCNLHGLFPSADRLRAKIEDRMGLLFPASTRQQADRDSANEAISHVAIELRKTQNEINIALQQKIAVSTLLAHSGYSLTFSHDAWRRRGAGEEGFSLAVDATRPEISVRPIAAAKRHKISRPPSIDAPQRAKLFYGPVPGLEYEVPIFLVEKPTIVEQRLREALRAKGRRIPFEYHVRLSQGQATSSYPDWVLEPSDIPPIHSEGAESMGHDEQKRLLKRGAIRVERVYDVWGTMRGMPRQWLHLRSKKSDLKPTSVALVGLMRQFFSSPVNVTPEVLQDLARREDGARLEKIRIGDKTVDTFVFCCHQMTEAIERAFRHNAYGDALACLRRWKQDVGNAVDTDCYNTAAKDGNQEWLLWNVAVLLPEIVPPYYFSKDELIANPTSRDVQARLAARQLAEIEMWMDSTIKSIRKTTIRYPGYDVEVERRRLYACLDADLLLRHLGDDDWVRLCEKAETLAALSTKFLIDRYSPSHEQWFPIIRALLPPDWEGFLSDQQEYLNEWVAEALTKFRPFPRILRDIVENLQRCALNRQPLLPIVLYPVGQLIAGWKEYVRKRLRPRFNEWCGSRYKNWSFASGVLDDSGDDVSDHKKDTKEQEWDYLDQWDRD